MQKSDKQKRITATALALALASLPLGAHAAGLGKITVLSALGQPLRAEIELSATRDEYASISAKLASEEAFKKAGIEYVSSLSSIRFMLDKRTNGQPYLRVLSDRPVNEPFVDMLVELNWASGRLVREYTFLLDPPDVFPKPATAPVPVAVPETKAAAPAVQPAAPVVPAAPAPVATPAAPPPPAAPAAAKPPEPRAVAPGDEAALKKPEPAKPEKAARAEKPAPVEKPKPVAKAEEKPAGGATREVRKGDTLGKIAAETRIEGVSLDQMLVALFRNNKDAFDGGNMNRLRAGRILSVPDKETAAAIEPGEARKFVVAQSADFNAYRQKLAGAVAATPAAKEEAPKQAASGKIAPRVEDKAPAPPAGKDRLEVSRSDADKSAKSGDAKAAGRIAALEEDVVARDKALKDANSRIADLEKNLNDLKKLVELKSQAGVAMQQQAQAGKPAAEAPKVPTPPAKPATPAKAEEPPKPEAAKPVEAAKPAEPAPAESAKPAEPAPVAPTPPKPPATAK